MTVEAKINGTTIRVNGLWHHKKRECWITSDISDPAVCLPIAETFCKRYRLKLLSHRIAKAYECHTWQHGEMFVFEVECSTNTSRFIYEFGNAY